MTTAATLCKGQQAYMLHNSLTYNYRLLQWPKTKIGLNGYVRVGHYSTDYRRPCYTVTNGRHISVKNSLFRISLLTRVKYMFSPLASKTAVGAGGGEGNWEVLPGFLPGLFSVYTNNDLLGITKR